tara:strand:- start:1030 stop:1191 length:162 start_codon:yes stop_codon:yes gene_type:complete
MSYSDESVSISFENETAEILVFKTEEQIVKALVPLMANYFKDKNTLLTKTNYE